MNILLLCPVYEPHAGGGGQYFPLLVNEVAKSNKVTSIYVLTEKHPDRPAVEKKGKITVLRKLPQRDTKQASFPVKVFSFFYTYFLFYSYLPRLIARYKINVIHFTRYLRPALYSLFTSLQERRGVKVVLDMRATIEDPTAIEKIQGIDFVISNSEAVYNQVSSHLPNGISHEWVKNPIRLPAPRSQAEVDLVLQKYKLKGIRYAVMVGQLLERKSSREVVEAFPMFSAKHPGVQLVFVGRNMLGKAMIDKIDEVGAIFAGPASHDEVLALMQASEFVVQHSKIEGIPRVSIEALALGKKVLLPPCAPELIRENPEYTVQTFDPKEIADAMIRVYEKKDLPKYDTSIHNIESSIAHVLSIYDRILVKC